MSKIYGKPVDSRATEDYDRGYCCQEALQSHLTGIEQLDDDKKLEALQNLIIEYSSDEFAFFHLKEELQAHLTEGGSILESDLSEFEQNPETYARDLRQASGLNVGEHLQDVYEKGRKSVQAFSLKASLLAAAFALHSSSDTGNGLGAEVSVDPKGVDSVYSMSVEP